MAQENEEPHVFPTARRPGELLFSLLFLLCALGLLAQIGWQTAWLSGKGLAAQPRTWPFIGLAGMVAFGAANAWATARSARTPGRWREAGVWVSTLEYVGWYLLYVFAVPLLGYLPSTIVFCLFLTWRAGYRSSLAFASALAFALFVVILFKSALHVKIPGGAAYEYLPSAARNFMIRYF